MRMENEWSCCVNNNNNTNPNELLPEIVLNGFCEKCRNFGIICTRTCRPKWRWAFFNDIAFASNIFIPILLWLDYAVEVKCITGKLWWKTRKCHNDPSGTVSGCVAIVRNANLPWRHLCMCMWESGELFSIVKPCLQQKMVTNVIQSKDRRKRLEACSFDRQKPVNGEKINRQTDNCVVCQVENLCV